tara:strand:- start:1684 stop:2265 length:582 start_codon:yes stop_codon:yes gene_type:complete
MKIKVCGITREEDIAKLIELKVNYIGFNLLDISKRKVSISWTLAMIEKYKLHNKAVLLIDYENISHRNIYNDLDLIFQIYHFEPEPNNVKRLFLPRNATLLKQFKSADFNQNKKHKYLFDNMDGALGGTGIKFNHNILKKTKDKNFMIAGGLAYGDLHFLKENKLWGVDLNSKFEITPGVKDHNKLEKLRIFL